MCRTLLQTQATVQWVDNFSKCYAVAMQGADSGAFNGCQWTGTGFHVYVGPIVDTSVGGLPGMPDVWLDDKTLNLHKSRSRSICGHKWLYFDMSLVKQFVVNNVPLKPVVDAKDDPELHKVLSESRDGLKNFHASDILPRNVGSNRGLLLILKDLSDRRRPTDTKLHFLTADCNIFMRMLKVNSQQCTTSRCHHDVECDIRSMSQCHDH